METTKRKHASSMIIDQMHERFLVKIGINVIGLKNNRKD